MTSFDRRSFLRLGAALSAAGVAGCLEGEEDREDAPFQKWVPAESETIVAAHVDLGVAEGSADETEILPLILPSGGDGEPVEYAPQIEGLTEIDDPLLTVPLALGGRIMAATIGFYAAGLGYLVDPEQSVDGPSDLFYVNGVVGVTGDLDIDRATEQLRSGTDGAVFQDTFERTGEHGGFELFEPVSDRNESVVAIESAGALMATTRAELLPVIDVVSGDAARAVETRDRFEWLVDTVGDGHFSVGWVDDPDLERFIWGNADEQLPIEFVTAHDAMFTSLTFDMDDGTNTARLAAQGISTDAARDRIEARLGAASDDLDVSFEDDRVSATGTYGSDALDVEFSKRGDGDDGEAVDPEVDPPQAVSDAVPADAFRFEHVPSENLVEVHVETSFEADELTVRTTESGSARSVSPVESVRYLTVYLDPDGDQVVVSVTVGDESGVVAVREFP
ncbi:hypothetical protein [Salinarchaeum laminariae]|uniref:hypothetical protein n=1 Tax=Salinarchaeum laminariae TaxID=869888 RepID=UPI0020C14064|nr:hypothetical protein [Salinarchaeum laminariae]